MVFTRCLERCGPVSRDPARSLDDDVDNPLQLPPNLWVLTFNSTCVYPDREVTAMEFPEHLRSLRKEARLSQRELAERVDVDFTYLSKIENGRVEPPSETVLKKIAKELAGALGQDETELADELITLAGKIPSDLAGTLARNPQAVQFLRSIGDDVRSPSEWQRLIRGRSQDQE